MRGFRREAGHSTLSHQPCLAPACKLPGVSASDDDLHVIVSLSPAQQIPAIAVLCFEPACSSAQLELPCSQHGLRHSCSWGPAFVENFLWVSWHCACAAWCLYLFVGTLMDGPATAMCSAVGLQIQVGSHCSGPCCPTAARVHRLRPSAPWGTAWPSSLVRRMTRAKVYRGVG